MNKETMDRMKKIARHYKVLVRWHEGRIEAKSPEGWKPVADRLQVAGNASQPQQKASRF